MQFILKTNIEIKDLCNMSVMPIKTMSYFKLIKAAIIVLQERHGSSVKSIKTHIKSENPTVKFSDRRFRGVLKQGLDVKKLKKLRNGCYKLVIAKTTRVSHEEKERVLHDADDGHKEIELKMEHPENDQDDDDDDENAWVHHTTPFDGEKWDCCHEKDPENPGCQHGEIRHHMSLNLYDEGGEVDEEDMERAFDEEHKALIKVLKLRGINDDHAWEMAYHETNARRSEMEKRYIKPSRMVWECCQRERSAPGCEPGPFQEDGEDDAGVGRGPQQPPPRQPRQQPQRRGVLGRRLG